MEAGVLTYEHFSEMGDQQGGVPPCSYTPMNAPEKIHFTRKQRFEAGKLHKRLCRPVGEGVGDYDMIRAGDPGMVWLSWGKDSYGVLHGLFKLGQRRPGSFHLFGVILTQR